MSNKVSIIIINYNTYELTRQCIASVIEKTKEVAYEIILVDNASTECDATILKTEFPSIVLQKSAINLGFSGGNNLGLSIAKGDLVLLLNSDIALINDAISIAARMLISNTKIGVLSGQLRFPDETLQNVAGRFPSLKNEICELFRLNKFIRKDQRPFYFLGNEWDYTQPVDADWVWGAFFMTRRSIIDELGGKLPDEFFMYGEDIDWCWRISKKGYLIHYSPDAKAYHYCGKSLEYSDEELKFNERKFPNLYKAVINNKGSLYAFATYFVRALLLITLRDKTNLTKAKFLIRFLFGKKNYWLN